MKTTNQTTPTQKEADKARAKAEALRAKAEALKAAARYEQDYGAGPGSDETAKAWDEYQEATNAAARADANADKIQKQVDEEKDKTALEAAAKVKLRDYMLLADIPSQAMNIPADITLGDLVDVTLEAKNGNHNNDCDWEDAAAEAVDWLESTKMDEDHWLDTEARRKLIDAAKDFIRQADDAEVHPLSLI